MIKVINQHAPKKYPRVFIGRGSVLGNPYHITPTRTREQVIELYHDWFAKKLMDLDEDVMNAMADIIELEKEHGRVDLQCFCAPQACHGDVIKMYLQEFNKMKATPEQIRLGLKLNRVNKSID